MYSPGEKREQRRPLRTAHEGPHGRRSCCHRCATSGGFRGQSQAQPRRRPGQPAGSWTLFVASVAALVCLCLVGCQSATAQSLAAMSQKLKIPDVIPITGSTATIRVDINGNTVKPGDSIPARNFKNLDIMKGVSWDERNYDARYTLMLLDLDRKPSGSSNANATHTIYNQYTSLNIPGNYIGAGQVIVAFDPPSVPCHPSTKHRLVMLAFHQDQNIDLADIAYISAPAGHSLRRENIKLDDFISRHRLQLTAANVFQALGEANGICSGAPAAHTHPHIFTLSSSILIAMVMFQALSRRRQ